jgi:sugar lactone lactonase YvrE
LQLGFLLLLALAGAGSRAMAQVSVAPTIATTAGNGTGGYSGDTGSALNAELNVPTGVALDSAGNLYIADYANNVVRKVAAGTGIITTVAGTGTQGYSGDTGLATAAELNVPFGIAVDTGGNLYIADSGNNVIRKVTSAGYISTVAGNGTPGYSGDGSTATGAELNAPLGVAVDSQGNLYLADSLNNVVRKVTGGTITTVAGNGTAGYSGDGSAATSAELNTPNGIAVSSTGNLYIADTYNNVVREMSAGTITTVAGNGTAGYSGDGSAATGAELNYPAAIAFDAAGNFYIADGSNNVIREVTAGNGTITTVAGNGTGGYSGDGGAALSAELNDPAGIVLDSNDDLYIADIFNNRIREVSTLVQFPATQLQSSVNQSVFFLVSANTTIGNIAILSQGVPSLDFIAQAPDSSTTLCTAQLYANASICTVDVTFTPKHPGARYGAVEVLDNNSNVLATAYMNGSGLGPQVNFLPGTENTVASSPSLSSPQGVAVDGNGNVYISDYTNKQVLKETPSSGAYTPSAVASGLGAPEMVAVDGSGNIYIADSANNQVLKETPSGSSYIQSIIASSTAGGLSSPGGVAVDGTGDVYIADTDNNRVLKETLLGGAYTQAVVPTSTLNTPFGVAVDGSGNVYITDSANNRVLKETLSGSNYTESTVASSGLNYPVGVSVDGMGNVYITDYNNNRVLEEMLSTGSYTQSTVTTSSLTNPFGVAVDGSGNIYLSDVGNKRVLQENLTEATLSFASTNVGSTSTDSPRTETVVNAGNVELAIPPPTEGANPVISLPADFSLASSGSCPDLIPLYPSVYLLPQESCTYAVDFSPATSGTITATLTGTDNNLNAAGSTQSISLKGTGVGAADITSTVVSVLPNQVTAGQTVTITATVSDTTTPGAIPTGGVTLIDTVGSTIVSLNGGAAVTLTGGVATLPNVTLNGVGVHTITANYAGVSGSFTLSTNTTGVTVSPIVPTLTFATIAPQTYGNAPFTVSATSASSGTVTYSIVSGPATIVGDTVTLTGAGAVELSASQAASGNYAATTTPATVSFTVVGEVPTLTFATIGSKTYGNAAFSVSATSASSGAVTYSVASGPAMIVGNTVTLTGAGVVELSASQAANGNYAATTTSATTSFSVGKAAPAVTLNANPNPVLVQNTLSLTATVSSTAGLPSGTVTFYDVTSNAAIGTSSLTAGVAVLNTAALSVGTHSITAIYSGDTNFVTLTSSAMPETVQDFSLEISTSSGSTVSQTVVPGGLASYTLIVSPLDGTVFPAALSFSIAGLPAGATAAFTPATLAAGSGTTDVTLSVQMPQSTSRLKRDNHFGKGLAPVLLGMLLLPFSRRLRRSARKLGRYGALAVVLLLTVGATLGLSGCGSSTGFFGQSQRAYNLTVTATSGALTHSSTVSLTVE